MCIGNGHVVDSLDMRCLSQTFDCSNEAFDTRVQCVLGFWLVVCFAPSYSLVILVSSEARCLAERNEPCGEVDISMMHVLLFW